MKRNVLVVALLAMVCSMKGQSEVGTWSIIPRVGINSSNMSNQEISLAWIDVKPTPSQEKSMRKLGLTTGVDISYQHAKKFSTTMGVFYSHEGYTYTNFGQQTFQYVDLSIVEDFYLLKGLALKTGLLLGYLFDNEWKAENVNDSYMRFNKWNLSLPIGISYTFHHIVLDLRYQVGLLNMNKHKGEEPVYLPYFHQETYHSNSLWLTLGYNFVL